MSRIGLIRSRRSIRFARPDRAEENASVITLFGEAIGWRIALAKVFIQ
jgi:hypothetical protein